MVDLRSLWVSGDTIAHRSLAGKEAAFYLDECR